MKRIQKILAVVLSIAMLLGLTLTASAAFVPATPATSTAAVTIEGLAGASLDGTETGTTKVDLISVIVATDATKQRVEYDLDAWVKAAIDDDVTNNTFKGVLAAYYNTTAKTYDVAGVIKGLGGEVPKDLGQQTYTVPKNEKNDVLAALNTYYANNKSSITATQTYTAATSVKTSPSATAPIGENKAEFPAVKVGYYLAIPTDTNNVYNPMSVGVGLVADANGAFTDVKAQTTVGKYTNVPFTKKQYNVDAGLRAAADGKVEVSGDYQIGDLVEYEIEATIPDYDPATYTKYTFVITDTLSTGLIGPKQASDLTVTINGAAPNPALTSTEVKFGQNTKGEDTFTIDLSDRVKGAPATYAKQKVKVVYRAQVDTDALTGFDPNTNTATLKFERTPGTDSTKEVITYAYSFAIDGTVWGNWKKKTWEYKKTGVGTWSQTNVDEIMSDNAALANAEFTIYEADTNGTVNLDYNGTTVTARALNPSTATNPELKGANPYKTEADGRITFEGLDANVEYYMTETKAPSGYSLNKTVTKFKFVPTYDTTTGKLVSYKVFIDDMTNEKWEYVYTDGATPKVSVTSAQGTQDLGSSVIYDDTTEIKNTQLVSLPSTGGIGTTIFTITGVILMVAAAAMMLIARRKREQ